MNFLHKKTISLAILLLAFGGFWATAQGQSPTSPRSRPDIAENPDTTAGETPADAQESSRFTNTGGRFDNQDDDAEREAQPPTRSATTEAPPEEATSRPTRTVTGSKQGSPTGSSGIVTRGNTPGAANGMNANPGVASGQEAGNFDAILQREVVYPPLPEGGEVLIEFTGPLSVSDFMEDIRVATLWNILVSEKSKAKVLDFLITESTPQQAMEILKFHDLYYEYDKNTNYVYVMTIEEWQEREFGDLEEEVFTLEHTDSEYLFSIINALLSSRGKVVSDNRTRRIYVWDTADNIALMKSTVAGADVPFTKHEFKIDYADFADMQAALSSMLSANGSLLPDSRTGTILVWDQSEVLARMSQALETIDVPVASKTFYVAHVSVEDLIDYLEVMISERGVLQIDPRYNAIIVTDLPGRIERIGDVLEVLDQELDTRTWVLNYADINFVAEQIESRIPAEMGEIIVQEDVHQLTVKGITSRLDEIDQLIKVWDVARKQVHIEAFIVEVGSDVEREFNINWSYFGSSSERPIFVDGGSGFNPSGGNLNVGQLPYSVPLYGALQLNEVGEIVRPLVTNIDGENVVSRIEGNNLAVTLDYLDQKNKATVLSSPRVSVQDGEEASFDLVTQVPFVSSTTFFNNSSVNNFGNSNNTNRVEFIDVGTKLRVLPRITTEGNILLDISAEDSTFVEVRILANDQQSTVPQKTERKVETQLRIQSGDTGVLGGLRRDRAGETEARTPLLGDLPGIGRLFRYPNRKSEKNTLLIFITPTIVDEFTDPQATMLAAAEESIAGDHRHNQKNLWGRIADAVSKRENELQIAVGQSGDIRAEGEQASMEDLKTLFQDAPANVSVVLRFHPGAPDKRIAQITALALEMDRKLEIDDDLVPLVPRFQDPVLIEEGAPVIVPATPDES